jgi:hypothetical protein
MLPGDRLPAGLMLRARARTRKESIVAVRGGGVCTSAGKATPAAAEALFEAMVRPDDSKGCLAADRTLAKVLVAP